VSHVLTQDSVVQVL